MKVKCINKKLTLKQLEQLGNNYYSKRDFHITEGKEYLVFGLTFSFEKMGKGCFIEHLTDSGHLVSSPICLFEVIDNRPSKYWVFKKNENDDVFIWPLPFFKDFFHDDLFENDQEVVNSFNTIKALLEEEFY